MKPKKKIYNFIKKNKPNLFEFVHWGLVCNFEPKFMSDTVGDLLKAKKITLKKRKGRLLLV